MVSHLRIALLGSTAAILAQFVMAKSVLVLKWPVNLRFNQKAIAKLPND